MPIHAHGAHTDAQLTAFAVAYKNGAFIADDVCPVVMVDKRSDKFAKRNRRDVSMPINDLIGPSGKSNRATYDVTTDNYSVTGHALHEVVDLSLVRNADAPISPEEWATQNVMQRLMLNREKRVADLIMTAGNWASGNTGAGTDWTDETAGTPLADLNTALEAIPSSGEDSRLILVLALPLWNALRKHPQMLGLRAGGGSSAGQLSAAEVAAFIGVDEVKVSRTFITTTNPGQSTAVYSRIWDATKAAIVQVPTVVSGPEASLFSCTFRVQPGIQTRKWHDPAYGEEGADLVQTSFADDEKVIQNDMGYLLTGLTG